MFLRIFLRTNTLFDQIFYPLIQNLALLSLGAVIIFVIATSVKLPIDSVSSRVLIGIVFGLVAVAVVSVPIEGPFGLKFDTGAAPVLVVGYVVGPLAGFVTAAISAVARYNVGGPAALAGAMTFFVYLVSALVFRGLSSRGSVSAFKLGMLAIFGTLCISPVLFVTQPFETGLEIIANVWPILLLENLLGTLILGLLVGQVRTFLLTRDEFEAILTTSPDGIITVDQRLKIRTMNPKAESLFGWSESELIGKDIASLVPLEVRPQHGKLADSFARDGKIVQQNMTGYRVVDALKKDGSHAPVLVSLAKIRAAGELIITATVHDMSEITRARRKLERMTETLAEQLNEARFASEAKNRFLANMSHELRTPLNAVIGYASMIRALGRANITREKLDEYVGDIQTGGETLLNLINKVIDISKLEDAEGGELALEPHTIGSFVGPVVSLLNVLAEQKSIVLDVDVNEQEEIVCDLQASNQALTNVLSNAIKFSSHGGKVRLTSTKVDDYIVLEVADEGPGFPVEVTQRLGEPFLRGNDPTTREIEGTGLGLALTIRLMERQGGRLVVTNNEPSGSRVRMILPR